MRLSFSQEEFEVMTLKQKESFIEKKHQELDVREEKSIKELDQLTQSERTLCRLLTAVEMELIPGKSRRTPGCSSSVDIASLQMKVSSNVLNVYVIIYRP